MKLLMFLRLGKEIIISRTFLKGIHCMKLIPKLIEYYIEIQMVTLSHSLNYRKIKK